MWFFYLAISAFLSIINRTMDSFCVFPVLQIELAYFYVFSSGLVISSYHVEPIANSLCIGKTSLTGKTCHRRKVIVSRNWKGVVK